MNKRLLHNSLFITDNILFHRLIYKTRNKLTTKSKIKMQFFKIQNNKKKTHKKQVFIEFK